MKHTYICAVILPLLLLGASFVGCGDDDDDVGSPTGTSGTSGTSGAGGAGGQAGSGGAGQGGSAGQGGAGGSAGEGSAGQGGVGTPCGGRGNMQCDSTSYCNFPLNDCGASDGQGVCTLRPQVCDQVDDPVCTCAGTVAGNACEAYASGSDLSNNGSCPPPEAKLFVCGETFCNGETEYCLRANSDIGGEPPAFACQALPLACGTEGRSCDCLADEPCGDRCEQTGTGFTLTCLGG